MLKPFEDNLHGQPQESTPQCTYPAPLSQRDPAGYTEDGVAQRPAPMMGAIAEHAEMRFGEYSQLGRKRCVHVLTTTTNRAGYTHKVCIDRYNQQGRVYT